MLLQKLVFFLHKKRPDMQHIQNRIESGGSEKKIIIIIENTEECRNQLYQIYKLGTKFTSFHISTNPDIKQESKVHQSINMQEKLTCRFS